MKLQLIIVITFGRVSHVYIHLHGDVLQDDWLLTFRCWFVGDTKTVLTVFIDLGRHLFAQVILICARVSFHSRFGITCFCKERSCTGHCMPACFIQYTPTWV